MLPFIIISKSHVLALLSPLVPLYHVLGRDVRHVNTALKARIAADAQKLWFWIPEEEIDHAHEMGNPACPRKR